MKSKPLGLVVPLSLAAALICLLFTTLSRWAGAASAASASSNPATPLEFVSSLGGSITSVAVSGTIAYVGQGGTFATFDISDLTQVSRLDYVLLPNFAKRIQVHGSRAYITYGSIESGPSGMQIVEVSNPQSLQLLGSYTAGGEAADVEVEENFAYLTFSTAVTASLQILNVTDPAFLVYQGGYFPSLNGYQGIEVVNGLAYLGGIQGLDIVDVQNPANPVLRGKNQQMRSEIKDVQVEGNLAVIVGPEMLSDHGGQLQVVDVSNPITPTLLGVYQNDTGFFFFDSYSVVSLAGNFAYVGSSYNPVDIIDLTTPTAPTLAGNYEFAAPDLQMADSRVYLAGGRLGLQIVDVTSPANPALLDKYELFGYLTDVQAQPPYIYTTDESQELTILDGTDLSSPLILTSPITPGYGRDLKVIGNVAYLNRYNYGFDIFDVTDPTSPTLRSHYSKQHGSYTGMTTNGNYAYIGELGNGMNVLDVSNPSNPQYLGNPGYISGSGPQAIKAVGNLVYIAAGNGGLVIVEVSNPTGPSVIGRYSGLWATGIDVVGNLAYVSDAPYSTGGLSIFDVSNPSAPVFLSKYSTVGANLDEVQVVNDLAYVADHLSGLWVIDVSNPLAPVLQEHAVIPGWTRSLAVVDDFIYLACGDGGLRILRLPNSSPHETSTPRLPITRTPSPSPTSFPPSSTPTPSQTPIPPPSATPTASHTPTPTSSATIKPKEILKLYLPFILN
jgi:hypothetical protein